MISRNSALLIVDVQEDFLAHPYIMSRREVLVATINRLIRLAKENRWPIIPICTVVQPNGENAMPHWNSSALKCIAGTAGAELASDLDGLDDDYLVVEKQFFSPFVNPQLLSLLCRLKVDQVVICGVHTHACVRETAVGAYSNNYHVILVEDAVESYDAMAGEQTIDWLRDRVAKVVTTKQLEVAVGDIGLSQASTDVLSSDHEVLLHAAPMEQSKPLVQISPTNSAELSTGVSHLENVAQSWGRLDISGRLSALREWLEELSLVREEIVGELIRSLGKPRRDAISEVEYGLSLIRATITSTEVHEPRGTATIYYEPHGVVLAITPWNNPFALAVGKLAPALAYGNTVAWKPAYQATKISQLILTCLEKSNLGSHVLTFNGGAKTAQQLVKHPSIAAVTFTGSISAGEALAQLCGQLFKPFQGELGGNNGCIVCADADLVSTAKDLAVAMFSYAGQRCTAIRRLVVADSIYTEFCDALAKEVRSLKVGDPELIGTDCGPLINADKVRWLRRQVTLLEERGAKLIVESGLESSCLEKEAFFPPSVYGGVKASDPAWHEEWFGPAVLVCRAQSWEEAMAAHNVTPHGLFGVIYTNNQNHVDEFMVSANVGMVSINQARPSFSSNGPFVGWGRSGMGIPEHGRWNRDFYSRVKVRYGAT